MTTREIENTYIYLLKYKRDEGGWMFFEEVYSVLTRGYNCDEARVIVGRYGRAH